MWMRHVLWICLCLLVGCEGLHKEIAPEEKDSGAKKQAKDAGDDEQPQSDAGHEAAGSGDQSGTPGAGGSRSGTSSVSHEVAGSSGAAGKPPAAGGGGSSGMNPALHEQAYNWKNVPADVELGSPGDLLFNTANCPNPPVIDTARGTIAGCDDEKIAGKFKLASITQSNTSLGTFEAGLLVTRRFVIEQGMNVSVEGNRPLIVVALDEAIINGQLQAAAMSGQQHGGGFGVTVSGQNGLGPGGGGKSNGDSGAGGAGFCGKGGAGGTLGMNGGKTYGNPENVPLIGGSSGGMLEYQGSAGGGAIQISAGTRIDIGILGAIHVGGGGAGFTSNGGGSGGAILLEAPKVRVLGHLAANGGGGSSPTSGGPQHGGDGTADDQPALGGQTAGVPKGGNGSAGSIVDGQPGEASPEGTLGGGGGGGAGRMRINVREGQLELTGAVISPAKDTPCFSIGTL